MSLGWIGVVFSCRWRGMRFFWEVDEYTPPSLDRYCDLRYTCYGKR